MSLNKIVRIWSNWNKREITSEVALSRMSKFCIPELRRLELRKKYVSMIGKCIICKHNKSRHKYLEIDNKCLECASNGTKCKGYIGKKRN